jgi:type I restriction enzyme S subunit
MSVPPYSDYKETGIAWLGKVPAHWSIPAVGYRYEVLLGKMLDERRITGEHLAPYLRNVDVQWDRINTENLPEMDFSGNDLVRYALTHGDLLVCEGGEVGRAAIWRGDLSECYYQKALHRLRCWDRSEDVPRFMLYLLRAASSLNVFTASEGKSTIAHLTAETLRGYRFAFPPFQEQVQIVDFLDRETGTIDALIAEQEKLLALLAEKRQATISHAVSHGLDSDVLMKESGVAWLGTVPAHWEVCQLKRVFSSVDYGISDSLGAEGDVAVLRMGNISDGKVHLSDLKYVNDVDTSLFLKPGDLLFNRTNSIDLVGKVGLFTGKDDASVSFASYLVRIRLVTGHLARFFAYLLNTPGLLGDVRSRAFEAIGQCNLNPTRYGQLTVAIPQPEEQEAIVDYLDSEIAKLDALKVEAGHAVRLLKERRSALITAAVTGKIDVRKHLTALEAAA